MAGGNKGAGNGRTQVALVTGASSGIGRAVAERLAADGFRVFGTSRRGGVTGGGIEMLALDVASDDSVQACVATLAERTGEVDVVVNNAGYLLGGAIEETTIEQAKAQFETNFFGAVRIIQAVLPGMRQRKSGRIVNITSLAGLVPLPFWGMYNASKFALEGLTETLRYELAPFAIHVSAIEAGLIRTRFYTDDRKAAPIEAYQPWHRRFRKTMAEFERKAPEPELVAEAVSKAVHAARPALRYKVTREATQFTLLRRFMPAGIFERALRAGFHLDDQKY